MKKTATAMAVLGALASRGYAEEPLGVTARTKTAGPTANSLDFGIFAGGFIASSDHEFYNPDTSMQTELRTVVPDLGVRLAYYPLRYIGAEGEFAIMPSSTSDGGMLWAGRGHAIAQLPMRITPFVLFGAGAMGVASKNANLGSDTDISIHAGGGARYRVWRDLDVRADLRFLWGPEAHDVDGRSFHSEFLLGASWTLGFKGNQAPARVIATPSDFDSDGVTDDRDDCPKEAGPAPSGCPDKDPDQDGFVAEADKCPEVKGIAPDGCPDQDPDGDKIIGEADACPNDAEDLDSFEDGNGCPDPDNDKDGVVDASDRCRDEAGVVENAGCPDTDKDGDTVVDRLDNCPDEKGKVENRGCKDKQVVVLTGTMVEILEKVYFDTDRDRIKERSFRLLDQLAKVLVAHPEIAQIEIGGHTDDQGTPEHNQDLSQRRAESVRAYLVKKGVDAARLLPKGFGYTQPIDQATTSSAREANRRVEFRVIQ